MKKINKTETLYEILNSKTFTVNVYQREYRWGRKQIEQLINDITDCFLLSYENGQFKHEDTDEVAQYGYYFMGSIIRTGDDSTREIIDIYYLHIYRQYSDESVHHCFQALIAFCHIGYNYNAAFLFCPVDCRSGNDRRERSFRR